MKVAMPALQADDYRLVSGLFLRLLALIYLVAFASLGVQIIGLAGADGILPYTEHLAQVRAQQGALAYIVEPTLFWLNASDAALQGATIAGCLFAVLLFFNLLPRVSLVALFVLYLSLFRAGQIFMNFQWDYLLLESGFLALFLGSGSRIVVWLYRWLLFRLRFLSGASKLLTQDPTWANLTALYYYFETQPLPHVGSWYADHLPHWLLRFGTGATLVIEIVVPFMMFMPRRPRFFAAWATILMQLLIMLTSNHNFFNLLTLALCLFLFDDRALRRVVPEAAERWLTANIRSRPLPRLPQALLGALGAVLIYVSAAEMWGMFSEGRPVRGTLVRWLAPYHVVNPYHVFPTMTTERVELIVEGSQDGEHWEPYEFKYKPGDVNRRPEVVIPHHPRLDWMMWFVPLMYPINAQWYYNFLERLRERSPEVLALLEHNPFPGEPPRYLRTTAYRYHFTDPATHAATGAWWTREFLGPFPSPWLVPPWQ